MRLSRILIIGVGLMAAPIAAAEPWRVASTPRFVIYAQLETAALRKYAGDLERFDKGLRVLRKLPDKPIGDANRLVVFVVANSAAVAKLAGAPGSNVAGFYHSRAGGSVAVTSREEASHWTDISPQVLLLHEYSHHFMLRNFPAAYPSWFLEGFAEFYSTARIDESGAMEVGMPANHRAYTLAVVQHPDIPVMLADPGTGGVGSMTIYAFGWLLTHYLTFSETRRGQLSAYLDAVNRGVPARQAAERSFGDLRQLERELLIYRARGRLRTAHLSAAELPIGKVEVHDLGAGEAAMMATTIRTRLAEPDKPVRDIANDARKVAASWPDDGAVTVALTEAELAGGNLDEADAAANRVLAVDPKSLRALTVRAESGLRRAEKAEPGDARSRIARDARRIAAQANRIDPDNPVPLVMFYRSFAAAGDAPTANAVTGLTTAHLLAPEDTDVRLLLARKLVVDAKLDQARLLLTPIAYNTHGGKQQKEAAALLATLPPLATP